MTDRATQERGKLPVPDTPTVSVIIPAYNTAPYIADTLDSVFAQTFTDFEVILINDGSADTDKLEEVIEPYRERIVYLRQENRGPSAARNAGIRCARGKYIAFLDSDDSWFSEYLSEQIKFLRNSQGVDMVYSDSLMYADTPLSGKGFFEVYPPRSPVKFDNLLKGCSILTHCVVVQTRIVREVGLFDEEFRLLEDIDLWLRIANNGGMIACNKQVLARRRYRPRSLSHVNSREMNEAQLRVMKKLGASLNLPAEMRLALGREIEHVQADLETEQGKRFLLSGYFDQASNSLRKASTNRPSAKLQLTLLGLRLAPHLTRSIAIIWLRLLHTADNLGMFKPGDSKVIKENLLNGI